MILLIISYLEEPSKLVVFVTNDLISVPSAAAAAEESAMVENPAARGAAVTGYALLQHSLNSESNI